MYSLSWIGLQRVDGSKKNAFIPVLGVVLAAVWVIALEEAAISSLGRVWGGLYCATVREGFSLAALSKLASRSIRNLYRER